MPQQQEQHSLQERIESPLLYTREDNRQIAQDFIHDSFGEFFFARSMAQDNTMIDLFWKMIKEPDLTDTLERRLKEIKKKTWQRSNLFFGSPDPGPFHELGIAQNIVEQYISMAADSTYFISAGLKKIRKIDHGYQVNVDDSIKSYLAHGLLNANHVEERIRDKAISLFLSQAGDFDVVRGAYRTEHDVLYLMLKLDLDPLPFFVKKYKSRREASERLVASYRQPLPFGASSYNEPIMHDITIEEMSDTGDRRMVIAKMALADRKDNDMTPEIALELYKRAHAIRERMEQDHKKV